MADACKSRAAGNPKKKGIFATSENKKAMPKVRACAIFRADSHRAADAAASANTKLLEE